LNSLLWEIDDAASKKWAGFTYRIFAIISKEKRMHTVKIRLFFLFFLCAAAAAWSFSPPVEGTQLKDLYTSGSVKLKEILRLDEESMPDDLFFEMSMDAVPDGKGNIFVADYRAHKIFKFTPMGKFLKSFGRNGQGPGDLSGPAYIAASGGRIMIYEIRNRRFSCFDLEGNFLFHHAEQGLGYRIQKVRALPNGDFVVEWDITNFSEPGSPQECRIVLYNPDMKEKKTLVKGKILLDKMISEPVRTNVPMPFPRTYHWDVSPSGKIIIGFSDKYQVDIYDGEGTKIRSLSRTYNPLPVTKKDEKDFFAALSFASSDGTRLQEPPDYVKKHVVFPAEKPAFRDIIVDYQGNILVCPYKKTREEEMRTFDAFDPDGEFIGSVRIDGVSLPKVSSRLRLDRDGFWWCHTDAEGLPLVSKWTFISSN
jgi:hypothetical protein